MSLPAFAIALVAALSPIVMTVAAEQSLPASSETIRVIGRSFESDGSLTFGYPGSEIVLRFRGSRVSFSGEVLGEDAFFNASVDGESLPRISLDSGAFEQQIAEGLDPKREHTLRLVRRNETWHGLLCIHAFSTDGRFLRAPKDTRKRRILSIGDSITSGEAADLGPPAKEKRHEHWNAEASYAWQLAKKFEAQINLVSYGGRGLIRDWQGLETSGNAPEFFERALPDAPEALWDHDEFQPDLVSIALGTNDFSQGIPEREKFLPAYIRFIERIQQVHPQAKILLISGPWFGEGDPKKEALNGYLKEVVDHFAATSDSEAPSVRAHYFSETYSGTELDAHPTAAQHKEMAANIAKTIDAWLGW